jgi:hypothetical protein
MSIVHNIQEDETVKDMGGNIARIYAVLENKQTKYQSPMIKWKVSLISNP